MKALMISIKPQWVEKILSGEKTVEVRKTVPKLKTPFKCYIYCAKNKDVNDLLELHIDGKIKKLNGKVVAECEIASIQKNVCWHRIEANGEISRTNYYYEDEDIFLKKSCLSKKEFMIYGNGETLYGWHISDLKVYDTPKELGEFSLYEKKDCTHFWCGICGARTQNDVINCNNLTCERKTIKRPFQSWGYVEEI